ncbi:MAG TPA: hypothetical protein VF613_25935 [Longimicrobium sp.]|jgi:hypothetical protein
MKKEAELEVRDEYDFSGGVRGRHAARFTARERDDLFRRAAVEDVQTWTMISLYEVQALEAAFFGLLVLTENRSPDRAAAESAALLTSGEAQPLGEELASVLRQRVGELDRRLGFVARERNWLVHRGVFEGHSALSHADRAPALLERLQHLVADARELRSHVEALVAQHLSEAGMSAEEAITRRDDTVGLWQAAA